ncbi:hypothetical protein GQ42DRAFT_15376 [Ramicandelaber brevisporus]|nr:hypothetical protein GQ42DRAFT_15376 [Ramicandelaber brevisporus]
MEDSAHVALHALLPHFFPLRTLDINKTTIRYSPFLSTALHQQQIQQSCRLLTKLCIRNIKITAGLIKFIGDTPSLRFLMFYECVWDATILPKRKSVVSTTVWRIVFDIDDQYIPDLDYWLDKEPSENLEVWIEVCLLFPNLKFISLMHCDDSSLKKVSAAFPNLIVSNRLYT